MGEHLGSAGEGGRPDSAGEGRPDSAGEGVIPTLQATGWECPEDLECGGQSQTSEATGSVTATRLLFLQQHFPSESGQWGPGMSLHRLTRFPHAGSFKPWIRQGAWFLCG